MGRKKLNNVVLFVLGTLFFAIGIIGVFVPVLPTTPFLLLASFFYLRSSKRMHHWLMNHRVFGSYIRNYVLYRAVPKPTKIRAILFLWTTLIVSMMLVDQLAIRIGLVVVGVAVSAHILLLKTLDKSSAFQRNEIATAAEETLNNQ